MLPLAVIGGVSALGSLRALFNWRAGLYFIIVLALITDPLRKITPGAPGYLLLASFPVVGAILLALLMQRHKRLSATVPGFRYWITIFICCCIPAAVISATYGPGSWLLTIFGIMSYSLIFLPILAGYNFLEGQKRLERFIQFYCGISVLMLPGAFIEYAAIWPENLLVGTAALDMEWIRHSPGYTVKMIAGFYRSPDVMGWHAATVAMLSALLFFTMSGVRRWVWATVMIVAIAALLLCGRRKMVYMIPLFLSTVAILYVLYGPRKSKLRLGGLLAVPALSLFLIGNWLGPESSFVRYYTETQEQAADQAQGQTVGSVIGTIKQSGFFGAGLGVASPGSHHLRVARPRVWQESGTSRVVVELGVPGSVALVGVLLAMLSFAFKVVRMHLKAGSPFAAYPLGLFAIFVANLASLGVSGQILADPFIAFFLGFTVGLVLSFGRPPFVAPRRRAVGLDHPSNGKPNALVRT